MNYFGTDGIRQEAVKFTPDFLTKTIKGLINYAGDEIKILLGGDTRESTEWILTDLESACETFGIEYGNVSILPTPAINYCFYNMGFDFAIDVTASHNPYQDNGIKIFERGQNSGQKLCDAGREAIELALSSAENYPPASSTLRENLHDKALNLYKKHLINYVENANFAGLNIGVDCANGATSVIAKQVFEHFGAHTYIINANASYNTKINAKCGSTHLESLQNLVAKKHLDFGVAFDGDGDRCLMVDNDGKVIEGDHILAILTDYLNLEKISTTVMANQGLLNWLKDREINTEITAVGDHNVAEAMRKYNISLGGEQSGHIILPGETTGDGTLTALMVSKIISESNKPLSKIANIITKFPQIIVNLSATPEQKQIFKENDSVKKTLLDYNSKLTEVEGRLLVRPSGTEPLIRITMWGNNENIINQLANELKTKLGEIL